MRYLLAVLLVCGLAAVARAGGPTTEQVAGHEAFAAGTLDGLTLDRDGVLRPGPAFDALDLDASTAWAAVKTARGLWVGTGNRAEVLRRDAGGALERIETGAGGLMVTALAPLADGGVAAAVFPGGRVLKISTDGAVSPLATLPVEFVWTLLADERGGLLAACGKPARLYAIDPFGGLDLVAEVDDEHLRCLTRAGTRLYAGTAPKGHVLSIEGGQVTVVRDMDQEEVVGLVVLADGSLVIAANDDQVGGNAQELSARLKRLAAPSATKPGLAPAKRAALQDGALLSLEPGGALTELWSGKEQAVLSLVPDGDGVVAGTYPGGRVLRVAPGASPIVLADFPEAEASVVLAEDGAFRAAVTSNPAVLHEHSGMATRGTWTSAPLDATAVARWGEARVWGGGVTAVAWRTGETETPDDTWGAWTQLTGGTDARWQGQAVARFLQVRVTLAGEAATLRALEVVRRTPNRAPILSDLAVKRPGENGKAPAAASAQREITWKVTDPDEDALRTTVRVNRRGSPRWDDLVEDEVLQKPTHTWDTTGWPDGLYQIEVAVSDADDNAEDRARTATARLTGVSVDNTPPRVTLAVANGKLTGTADDGPAGRVRAVRVSIDGGRWIQLAAGDGLYDGATETFAHALDLGPGPHDVVVQAHDAVGNVGTAATAIPAK